MLPMIALPAVRRIRDVVLAGQISKKSGQAAVIRKHVQQLIQYLEAMLNAIFGSVEFCPTDMRHVFSNIMLAVRQVQRWLFSAGEEGTPCFGPVGSMLTLPTRVVQFQNEKLMAQNDDTMFTAVSGFLFLRFFAPAVLNPKLFGACGREGHLQGLAVAGPPHCCHV
jgi:hypothetical protein